MEYGKIHLINNNKLENLKSYIQFLILFFVD